MTVSKILMIIFGIDFALIVFTIILYFKKKFKGRKKQLVFVTVLELLIIPLLTSYMLSTVSGVGRYTPKCDLAYDCNCGDDNSNVVCECKYHCNNDIKCVDYVKCPNKNK